MAAVVGHFVNLLDGSDRIGSIRLSRRGIDPLTAVVAGEIVARGDETGRWDGRLTKHVWNSNDVDDRVGYLTARQCISS